MRTIRVMVVDDSALMRHIIADQVRETPGMEVVAQAPDGRKAVEIFDSIEPDVVTLDVQMPNMDGLATLDALLAKRPVPIIMCSSLTQAGADITLEALDRGAMDYVPKPQRASEVDQAFREELVRKIRMVSGCDVPRIVRIRRERARRRAELAAKPPMPVKSKPAAGPPPSLLVDKCIAIGISTGGPPALAQLFETLQPPMPPILVVQHMPPQFTKPLSWRLNSLSALSIKEAAAGDLLEPNQVYIAPGGYHMEVRPSRGAGKIAIFDGEPVSGHKPSVDVMMRSAAQVYGSRVLGVIMTGMGRDGSDGCGAIRAAGGYVLGQDEASSDVYGMNKVAFVEGNVDRQFHLSDAAAVITHFVRRNWLAGATIGTV